MNTEQTNVKCNICGSDDYTVLFEPGKAQVNRIVRCNNCDLIYANPQTDNVSDVEENYKNPEGITVIQPGEILERFNSDHHQYLKKQFLQVQDYKKILDFINSKEKGVFLEIGSFAGVFLNEARKRGWKVMGIEPLEAPAIYSKVNFGIEPIKEYFEVAPIENNSVDVIVSCHVIEHVPDPGAFVSKAYSLLRSGGNLILETPAYDTLLFKVLKHRERSVKCNGHIYFFTRKTLSRLVEKNGFKVVKHEKVGRTLTLDRLFYNLGVISGKKEYFTRLSQHLKLDRFIIHLNMRDMQRIYCQKA